MAGKVIVASIFVVVILCVVQGQVSLFCRPKERFLLCGCPKTCQNPVPDCRGVCRPGCYCEEGQVRNYDSLCVNLADCPPITTAQDSPSSSSCPENEEYQSCSPCQKTCDNPNPMCPAQCTRGCFCKEGLLRSNDGNCVKPENCSTTPKPIIQYQMTCSDHQVYKQCEKCEKTCSDPNPKCPQPCAMGCFCEEGYVKSPNGQCVKLDQCPKAEVMIGPMAHDSQELSVEDCAPDEEYFSCGWCEPSCSQPAPSCPIRVCTRGCLCRPPLLRHHSGHCVEEKDCFPQKCKDPNEEYVCRYGCELGCEARPCVRPRRCLLGCHCRLGLVRDSATGRCVTRDKCSNTTDVNDIVTNLKNRYESIIV